MNSIKDKAAIVGIGATDFSQDAKRTPLHLACECILAAIKDAGLKVQDIDGMVKAVTDPADEQRVIRSLGIDNLTYTGECSWYGGASSSLVARAVMAVAAGMANNVVVYWTVNNASQKVEALYHMIVPRLSASEADTYSLCKPFGLTTEPARIGMIIRRYMHETGISRHQFGWVPVVCRQHAAKNPAALFYKQPITIKDYLASEMIVDPLCSMDCHSEMDGAVAMVITTAARAKDRKQRPVYIMAGAQSAAPGASLMTSYFRPVISELPEVANVGKALFQMAGVTPQDIDVAQLDDSYAPLVPMELEALGFCGKGEGGAFCEGGKRIKVGESFPLILRAVPWARATSMG